MKLDHLDEPLLQFDDGTHVDVRAGILNYGTLDRESQKVPRPIRIGLVGTRHTTHGVRVWLEAARDGIESTEARLKDLRPSFPGLNVDRFGTKLAINDSTIRFVSPQDLAAALTAERPIEAASDVFVDHARDLTDSGSVDVLIVAPPAEVFALSDPKPKDDQALDEGSDETDDAYTACFHDLYKARALSLNVPSQVIRPDTYGGGSTRKNRRRPSLQDEATRAWNFHTALYYKAGAVPWRLVRDSKALTTCYIGVSFFLSTTRDRMLTSVAQVFDERGEGVIVQGGAARIDKDDRSPHLPSDGAATLLKNALAAYRREHHTSPARIVLHKTSYFDDAEVDAFTSVATEHHIDALELISVRRGGIRLFRDRVYPVLRGTHVSFDDANGMVYLRGSVPQFRTYPGMYIPAPIEFTRRHGEAAPAEIARELLELSKLNFNNTQFDGGEPITVRAARRVGDILKNVQDDGGAHRRFRYFT